MASRIEPLPDTPGDALPGSEQDQRIMEELRRVQLANEGMRLLLSSEVKKAEELFKSSRYLGAELNAGYSFVQFVYALMSLEEDAMDSAYKTLEGTEKFCDTGRRFSNLFTPNLSQVNLTPHQKLYRKSIVADCLLFEAILVFLKQGLTSYVKGGYILRKAWKMYEKVFRETEGICLHPSPITDPTVSSAADKHVGSSLYDKSNDPPPGEGEEEMEQEAIEKAISDTIASMQLRGEEMDGVMPEASPFGMPEAFTLSVPETSTLGVPEVNVQSNASSTSSHDSGSHDNQSSRSHDQSQRSAGDSHDKLQQNSTSSQNGIPATLPVNGNTVKTNGGSGTSSPSSSEQNLLGLDEPDGGGLGVPRHSMKRPESGYLLPADVESSIDSLEHQDGRLRGAVYFGYGLMNIIMSMIPPQLVKLANLFGFHGNRRVGLQALEYASNSQDMKAPLARIALLWYHTIVRPFFALDGEDEDAGADEAERLLGQVERKYAGSALFLYFKGKILYLRCQLDEALEVYTTSAGLAKEQKEIEHIVLYEKGWIHFLQLDFAQALSCYVRLKNETRWSACYYAYLSAVMTGVLGDLKQSRELFLQAAKLVKRKNNNLEKFCSRRANFYKKGVTVLMPLETILMAVEVIYLWRALPFCSEASKNKLLEMLSMAMPPDAQPYHRALRAWLYGGVLNSLGRTEEAEKSLHEAVQYDSHLKHDKHILSFSLYELALIHIDREEFARARTLLQMAKEQYSGYEFEARLNFKVHFAMNLLR